MGERIRFYRDARGKTQAVVAGLVGISEGYLSQLERGLKTPSLETLERMAQVLRVQPVALLDDSPGDVADGSTTDVVAVRRAMTAPWLEATADGTLDVDRLALWIGTAWSGWQGSSARYTRTASILPGLVTETEAAIRALRAPGEAEASRRACAVASDLYFLLRSFCRRTGQLDLALLAADRGIRLAEDSGDPLRIAASRWNLCHALLANGEPDRAELVALDAVRRLEPVASTDDRPDALALLGALYLVAAVSGALCGDCESARRRVWDVARKAASLVGERNVCWTAFGPANVGIHAVNIEIQAGRVRSALGLARQVDSSRSNSVERHLTFLLDIARCHEHRSDDAAVLDHLLLAERVACEDLRYNPVAHDLVGGLIARARRSSAPAVHQLARRVGIVPS